MSWNLARLLKKDLLVFLFLNFEVFFAELVHLHELDFVGVLERRGKDPAVVEFPRGVLHVPAPPRLKKNAGLFARRWARRGLAPRYVFAGLRRAFGRPR